MEEYIQLAQEKQASIFLSSSINQAQTACWEGVLQVCSVGQLSLVCSPIDCSEVDWKALLPSRQQKRFHMESYNYIGYIRRLTNQIYICLSVGNGRRADECWFCKASFVDSLIVYLHLKSMRWAKRKKKAFLHSKYIAHCPRV